MHQSGGDANNCTFVAITKSAIDNDVNDRNNVYIMILLLSALHKKD